MKMDTFLKTWEGSLEENKWNRFANIGLAAAVLLLAYMAFTKDEIVVLKPQTLGAEAWVTKSQSSQSYKESWGLYFAQLTGNVTPSNVDFLKERLSPLLSPAIYGDVIDTLEMQAQSIKDDRVTIRFEPRFVEFEKTSDKVFVYGWAYEKGATGHEEKYERTYEYSIRIYQYAPMIVDLTMYTGKPRTEKVLEQLAEKERRDA